MERSDASARRRNIWIGAGFLVGIATILSWPTWVGRELATSGYMPHGHCYLWQPPLVGLHLVSDTLIGTAYLAISLTLVYLVVRARSEIPFTWMFLAFGAFILACGATHFMEVWTMWTPSYWASGNVKLITAIASVTTAVALPPLVPRVLQLVQAEGLAENRRVQLLEAEERAALAASAEAARREAEAARGEAERANRAKDQFLATVSHELRNPLSPILAWSRMLRAGALDGQTTQTALEAIERCAVAQSQLIDDLLDVSRITSGKLRMDVRRIDLPAVIDAAVLAARPAADAKQIQVQLAIDPQTGPITGDPERLQQVVWNLLSNAVKAAPRNGLIRIELARDDSYLELRVTDDGVGIAPELLPHLFERFWQAEGGAAHGHGGLGLGLAIVRHIVELHGGSVYAHSDGPGRGAEFRIILPLRPELPADSATPSRLPPAAPFDLAPAGFATLDGVRVLVIDDEPDANAAVQAILSRCGADVRVAASSQQAMEIFERWRPHVVVSDIGMPGEDGYALIGRIRARGAAAGGDVPALALTAYARAEDHARAVAAGFQMHMAKPVDPSELGAAVARLVGRHGEG